MTYLRQIYSTNTFHLLLGFFLIFEMLQLSLVMTYQSQFKTHNQHASKCEAAPPYKPAVTSARYADRFSRASIFLPTAACIGSWYIWRGMTFSDTTLIYATSHHTRGRVALLNHSLSFCTHVLGKKKHQRFGSRTQKPRK